MAPDSNRPIIAAGQEQQTELRKEEARLFSRLHSRAPRRPSGDFRLGNFPKAPGKSAQWPHWVLDNRDCSQVERWIAETLGEIEVSVIDRAECRTSDCNGGTIATHRTVAGHAMADGEPRMLAMRRREETGQFDLSNLAATVLGDYIGAVKEHGLSLASGPLFGLDSELADTPERRRLFEHGMSYALLLEPCHPFLKVICRPEDAWDVTHEIAAEDLFDTYKSGRDKSKPDYLPIADLTVGDSGSARKVTEFVVEIPTDDDPIHFVALPILPPLVKKHEQKQRGEQAIALAERAAQLMGESPAAALRAHEFHSPREDIHRKALNVAQWGRLV